jgi:hypothetical protein
MRKIKALVKWLPRSPMLAFVFLGFVGLIYWLLGIGQGNSDIAKSVEWVTWKFLASSATAIAVASAVLGGSAVRNVTNRDVAAGRRPVAAVRESHRLGGGQTQPAGGQSAPPLPRAERLAEPIHKQTKRRIAFYIVIALVLIATIVLFLIAGSGPKTQTWPADLNIEYRTRSVFIAIAASAVPWLVLVWLLQDQLTTYAEPQAPPTTEDLRRLWDSLYAIVLAFAVFVVLALVTSGALRLAYFAGAKDPAANKQGPEFPASNVLLYGAFFAILLSAIALPLVAAYRAKALRRLRLCHPIKEPPDEKDKDATEWQESLLHLDIGVLRSPITALTVFTPLITAALTAYLPDLAD